MKTISISYMRENPEGDDPYILGMDTVGDFYRVSDLVFMPSHREGFGMPILEAGFIGRPVFSTNIPAAEEIGGKNVFTIRLDQGPKNTAELILDWASTNPINRFRVKTRQEFTWVNIFREKIKPLLMG